MRRTAVLLPVLALLGAAPAAAAPDAATGVRFAFAPAKVQQEKQARVTLAVTPRTARCTLAVRYADGSVQRGLGARTAVAGAITWTWRVPASADGGPARVTAACGKAGTARRTIVIVGQTTVPVRLAVVDHGYTQRNDRYGTGSTVSYGVMVKNPSATQDATTVTVLLNFLDGSGRIVGSKTDRLAGVAAGATYGLGGYMTLLTQEPVARLEIAITSATYVKRALHFPGIQNVAPEPDRFEPEWVGAVAGEIVNGHPTHTLARALVSIVLTDSEGVILGGGTAFVSTALPPGTRVLFKGMSGYRSIPVERVAATIVTVEPTWQAPDS
jgi:hypothetical protein